jgi:lysophospholipid acyltransferase (LPLAT)-like uncharacterized protein
MNRAFEHLRQYWVVLMGFAWAWLMRLEACTWRRQLIGREVIDALYDADDRALVVIWHGQYRPVLACVRDRPCVVVSTDTFRGRIIEEATRHLGHHCVLRPPALRGEQALAWLYGAVREASRIVLVADGPAGPARKVKRGVVQLASRLRLRIVPCAAASGRAYTRGRWDDQEIPLPLSRVAVRLGEPLPPPPPDPGEAEIGAWRDRIAGAIDECRREALEAVARSNGPRGVTPSALGIL